MNSLILGNSIYGEMMIPWFIPPVRMSLLSKENVTRSRNGEGVDRFYFSIFHGGRTAEWAPEETCFLNIDDILLSSDEKYFKRITSSR
jgi:hypothetical protein